MKQGTSSLFSCASSIHHKGHEVTQRKFEMIVFPWYLCDPRRQSRFSLVLLRVLCGSCLWLRLRRAVPGGKLRPYGASTSFSLPASTFSREYNSGKYFPSAHNGARSA